MATYWENSCSFGLRYVSWYKYLIVSLVFSHLGFWSGNLFLIAPFPDLCLLVPLYKTDTYSSFCTEITTDLPDKNNQRPLLNIIIYSGRHLKRHLENTKLLNDAKVASLRFL